MAIKYNMDKLQKWADYHAKNFWIAARKEFGAVIGEMPIVKLNPRLTSTAGRAWIEHGFIDLSCYLMSNNAQAFADDTIPHELCHMIAWRLYQDRGHGKGWKFTMQKMGLTPTRCHDMETLNQAKARLAK